MTRREAREEAFFLLFEYSFYKDISMESIIEKTEEYRIKLVDFTKETALNVEKNIEGIDEILSKNLSGWRIERISKMSLAILRIALYEICFEKETPHEVSMNEAIEIMKKYGIDSDPAFVNGVLSSAEKEYGDKKGDV